VVLALVQALIEHPQRTLNASEIDVVVSQTCASEAMAAEQARRTVWRHTLENSENFAVSLTNRAAPATCDIRSQLTHNGHGHGRTSAHNCAI
jgi:hypothetical protein